MAGELHTASRAYVLDTNVLIHDPNAILNFQEHHVIIPITVLEELDKLKIGNQSIATDCRQAIRLLDRIISDSPPEELANGIAINKEDPTNQGRLSILMTKPPLEEHCLPNSLEDNIIINSICQLQKKNPDTVYILVTKDINMRLKARGCGIYAEDYQTDQLVTDIESLHKGYTHIKGSFWENVDKVKTEHQLGKTIHTVPKNEALQSAYPNQYFIDDQGFIARVLEISKTHVTLVDLHQEPLMHQEAWGLKPRDIYQAIALHLLLDPDILLVNLTGAAGSGKTILALAAAIEMTVATKRYKRIIATRSTRGLDEDIGFLPGTEAEKMEPWLGAITDNLEALHHDDENTSSSVDYILQKVPLQFKSLNYIRGRSFQNSFIIIDESQNLTPHQIKTIITRAGQGSKVVCLGNLAQIDTPYLNPMSSGLSYMSERFKSFEHSGSTQLQGVPRSLLAEFAEANL